MDEEKDIQQDETSSGRSIDKSNESEISSSGRLGRMQHLINVMDKMSQKYFKSLKLTRPLTNANPAALQSLHKSTIEQLQYNIKTRLEQYFEEENIEALLNKLDELEDLSRQAGSSRETCHIMAEQYFEEENIEALLNKLDELEDLSRQAGSSRETWRPSGKVPDDSRPHVVSLLHHKQEALQKTLDDLEAKNKLLLSAAQKREDKVLKLHNAVLKQVSEFETLVEHVSDLVSEESMLNQLSELKDLRCVTKQMVPSHP